MPESGVSLNNMAIQANVPAFYRILDRRAEILHVATGFQFADGPVYGRTGFMLFTDAPSGRILKYRIPTWKIGPAEGELSVFSSNSNRAQGLTLDHQGRLLICESGPGRVTRLEHGGQLRTLADQHHGKRLNSPAEVVYAIDGSIYFTDLPKRGRTARTGRSGLARVYQITRHGELRAASAECDRPAGVALGPKQLDLYVTDSGTQQIWVFNVEADGSLSSGRVFAELPGGRPGRLGGVKTDEENNVYAAGAGGVWVFNAEGQLLGTVALPEQPSSLCWGRLFLGLYVTARTSVYYFPTKIPGTRTF